MRFSTTRTFLTYSSIPWGVVELWTPNSWLLIRLLTTYPWWPKIFKMKCRLATQSHAPWQITGVSRISTSTDVVCPSCSQHLASLRTSDCTLQAPHLPWHASLKGSRWPTAALVLAVSRLGGIQQWGPVERRLIWAFLRKCCRTQTILCIIQFGKLWHMHIPQKQSPQ